MRNLAWLALCCSLLPAQSTVTIAGTGKAGFSGDGGAATQAQVNNPYGLTVGPDGALYFCEIGNHRVRRLDLKTHIISTVAGSGQKGYSGDGGPALEASLNEPYEVRFDTAGNMFFAEMQNHVVRRVDAKTHVISTVAGTGTAGFGGDGGPAAKAQLRQPHSIAFDPQGRLLICDIGNLRIRRVDLKTGIIETWAGTGERKPTPDGAPIAGTPLERTARHHGRSGRQPVPGAARRQRGLPDRPARRAHLSRRRHGRDRLRRRRRSGKAGAPCRARRGSPGRPTAASTWPTPRATPSAAST